MAASHFFVDPEVLYSADLNSVVLHRFASAATRDSTITAPQAGQVCYVIGTGYQCYSGSAWVTAISAAGVPTPDATKAPLASPTFTGVVNSGSIVSAGASTSVDARAYIARVSGGGTYGFYHDQAAAAGYSFYVNVTGEANPRFNISGIGAMNWGAGGASATDVNLYRASASVLKSDGAFTVAGLFSALFNASVSGNILVGGAVTGAGVVTSTSATTAFYHNPATAAGIALSCRTGVEANQKFTIDYAGIQTWGAGGATAPDTNLYRRSADSLATDDDFAIVTAGKGIRIKEGSNAKMGVSTLVAGTVVVANTSVTATSRILLTSQLDGGTPGFLRVSTRTAGTSFTILSSSATDTSVVFWQLFEPA